ncbi:MAG: PfkB family carbohydrate kinase [Bacteroidales bacterium]|nr:PfkB family carbohydrate kinase [Bacteroidales bacterium]
MRKVYCVGETVFDIIFKNSKPIEAKPGGSMLNTAVSLGRMNVPVNLVSEYSKDAVGNLIDDFLKNNNVGVDYIFRFINGKTPLALGFLNNENNADYSFYKIYPEKRLAVNFPEIKKDDIILFGSLYSISKEIWDIINGFLKKAKHKKAILIYDPNYRTSNLLDIKKIKPYILKSISFADIVRGSDEDFKHIFGTTDSEKTFDFIRKNNCFDFIYTANKNGVYLHTENYSKKYKVPEIKPVSTIAAGDSFNAGLIYSILKNKISFEKINSIKPEIWNDIIKTSIDFATDVCLSYENYVSANLTESLEMKTRQIR